MPPLPAAPAQPTNGTDAMVFALIDLVRLAGAVLTVLIFVRVILSWVMPDPRNPLVGFVYRVTEPLLAPIRNILPAMGGIDFSPFIALVLIQVAERVLVRILIGMAGY